MSVPLGSPDHGESQAPAWKRFVRLRFPDYFPIEPFHELVYDAEAWPFIKERWSEAKFTDASDCIHEGRFEVEIPGIEGDDFYPAMIREGWARACFAFELSVRLPERRADVERWIAGAKALKEVEDAAA